MAEASVAQNTGDTISEENQDQATNITESRQQTRFKFWHLVGTEEQNLQKEIHEKRLENLRKELVGVKNTEWQYESLSKHIGQA